MSKAFKYTIIIVTTFFLFLYIALKVFKPGYIIHVDVTEGLYVDRLYERYIHTYSDDIGEALSENARIPLFYILYGAYKITGLPDSYYVKIKILILTISTLAVYTVYILKLLKFLDKDREEETPPDKLKYLIPALLGGFYYLTNYWFTNRIMHFYLFFSSLTVPITFYYTYTFLNDKKVNYKRLAILILLLGLLSPTPHTVLFEFVIIGVLFLSYLIKPENEKDIIFKKTTGIVMLGIGYILINLYWLLPYLYSLSTPDAVLSETVVEFLSQNATIGNSFRLMGYWLTENNEYFFSEPLLKTVQEMSTYFVILLPLLSLKFLKKHTKTSLAVGSIFFISLFLATKSIFSYKFYFYLMFDSPLGFVGWLFREIDKFGLILAFIYSLLISFSFFIFHKQNKLIKASLILVYSFLIVNNLFFLNATLNKFYRPQQVPNDFFEVYDLLNSDPEEFNVAWYPGVPRPFWSTTEEVRFKFTNLLSPKPAITTRSDMMNYLHHLFKEENIYYLDLGNALNRIGIKYLIIRKDESIFNPYNYKERLSYQPSLDLIYENGILVVYKNNAFSGVSKTYTNQLYSNYGLDTYKRLASLELLKAETDPVTQISISTKQDYFDKNAFIDYTDKPSNITLEKPQLLLKETRKIDIILNRFKDRFVFPAEYTTKKDDGNPGFWKLGSLENLTHAETDLFFQNKGLNINQFDYEKGIAIARDGWQKLDRHIKGDKIEIHFTEHPNLELNNKKIIYSSVQEDFKYYWNIIRSDKFNIQGISGIEVKLKSQIDEDLIPHFKVYAYDRDMNLLEIKTMYPDISRNVHSLIKLPTGAVFADFSIWTRSDTEGYSYEVEKFEINDISSNVFPIEMYLDGENTCTHNCHIFARLLKSNAGGTVFVNSEKSNLAINTKPGDPREKEEFIWFYAGNVKEMELNAKIRIINQEGFNAINAILILNDEEYEKVIKEASELPPQALKYYTELPTIPYISTTKINPAKYEITVPENINEEVVLAFSKPYSKNWLLNGRSAELVNGYINGWKFDSLEQGTYIVEYGTEEQFFTGVKVSLLTTGILLVYLIFIKVDKFSVAKSTSQG